MNKFLSPSPKRTKDNGRTAEESVRSNLIRANTILSNKRLIASVALLVVLAATLYALTTPPVYQASMLIQIKRSLPLSGEPQADIPAATEVELLRSRSVLTRVVDILGLDISAEPKRFPVLGAYLARRSDGLAVPGLFGAGDYAWGRERAKVAYFMLPALLQEQPFTLTATGKDAYTLTQARARVNLSGKVGDMAVIATPHGRVAILVSELHARPGVRFTVTRSSEFQTVDRLQRALVVSETGKQSNIISLSLTGSDPEAISRILNEIGGEYIRQHATRLEDDTGKVQAFYERQLLDSAERMRQLDARNAQILGALGSSDPEAEARIVAQQSVALLEKLGEAERFKSELSERYLSQHPAMIVATERVRTLKRELERFTTKRRHLAAAERQLAVVASERQANAEINNGLVQVRQKLNTMVLPTRTDIRMVDRAEPPVQAVSLGLGATVALACIAGLIAGILASILRTALAGPGTQPSVPRHDGQFRLV